MSDGGRVRDERGFVVGWLIKVVLALGIFALAAFEAGAVVVARVQIDDAAIDAAVAAADEMVATSDLARAEEVARDVAETQSATLVRIRLTRDRRSVVVTLSKRARTVLVQRIGSLERYALVTSTHSSRISRR